MTTPQTPTQLLYPADNKDPNGKKKHHWVLIALGVIAVLIVAGVISNAAKGSTTVAAAQAAPVTATVTAPAPAAKTVTAPAPAPVEVEVAPAACLKVVSLSSDLRTEIDDLATLASDGVTAAYDHDSAALDKGTVKIKALNGRLDATRAALDIYGPQCMAAS